MIRNLDDSKQITGYEAEGAKVFKGEARITGPGRVEVAGQTVQTDRIIIATGSDPSIPAIPGLQETGYWTNREATTLRSFRLAWPSSAVDRSASSSGSSTPASAPGGAHPVGRSPRGSRGARPLEPHPGPMRGFCCRDRQAELHHRFFDRDRLPLPTRTRPDTLNGHYPAFRYYSVLGLLLGHQPSSSRSPTYRPLPAGTQQISWGETLRFRRDRVATTPSAMTGIGHRRCVSARPPRNALRRFTFVRHHNTSMASLRPALTEARRHNQPP